MVPYLDNMFPGNLRNDPFLQLFLDNLPTLGKPGEYRFEVARKTINGISRDSRLNVGCWRDTRKHSQDGFKFLDKVSSELSINFDRDELSYMTAKYENKAELIMFGVDIDTEVKKIKIYVEFNTAKDLITESLDRHKGEFGDIDIAPYILNDTMLTCFEFYPDGHSVFKPYLIYQPYQATKFKGMIDQRLIDVALTSIYFYTTFRRGLSAMAFVAPGQIGKIVTKLGINNIPLESLAFNGIPPYTFGVCIQEIPAGYQTEHNLYYLLP